MARLPRFDAPGRLFHVMNRGLARRTVFESREVVSPSTHCWWHTAQRLAASSGPRVRHPLA
jgi:hypothetical protein